MSLEFQGQIVVTNFQSQSSGDKSPWTAVLQKQGTTLVISLHWTDKPASNVAVGDLAQFKQMVASL